MNQQQTARKAIDRLQEVEAMILQRCQHLESKISKERESAKKHARENKPGMQYQWVRFLLLSLLLLLIYFVGVFCGVFVVCVCVCVCVLVVGRGGGAIACSSSSSSL